MTANDAEALQPKPPERAVLLLVSVPRALEERMIDWLLGRGDVTTFSSAPVDVHGVDPGALVGAERVSARRRETEFRVRVPAARVDEMISGLAYELGGALIDWVALPIEAEGRLR